MICDYYLSLSQVQLDQNIDDQISEVGKKKKDLDKLSKNQYYNFYPTDSDLQSLPQNSTLLKISFTLKKPYTSKDEGEFHIIDNKILENPIVRDKFTGLPMVKPTTWKGHLRFAANKVEWQNEQEKKRIIKRLFGSEPEEKDNPLKGRLTFFLHFSMKRQKKM
ncbi:MAG: RAMP superfamily CRISPR-associated protein [Candidatus Marinimicrobia bacterium]|nr:RAMP superfamily CRISPR-associated protein [Candidatus Neomarinimicrobiota bacterium]